jgi:hypothetical protein
VSCETVLASEAYLEEARRRGDVKMLNDPQALAFDAKGDLVEVF